MGVTSFTGAGRLIAAGVPPVAALLALLLLAACSGGEDAPPQSDQVVLVTPAVDAGDRQTERTLSGRVDPAAGTALAFQVSGRLARIHVREGMAVRAGQLLAEIDPGDFTLRLREARVAEATAAAQLERQRALLVEGILSAGSVEQAEQQYASARAERQNAGRQVAYTRLAAPYAGRIGQRLVDVGTLVSPQQPVFQMIDRGVVQVAVDLSEADVLRLPLDRSLDAFGRFPGPTGTVDVPLAYVEHSVVPEERSRTYQLVLRGRSQPGLNLLPGMAVRVVVADPGAAAFAAAVPADERLVPLGALQARPDRTGLVWTVDRENRARPVAVRLLGVVGDRARVSGPLPAGAMVVVAGGGKLSDGQPVRPTRRS